MTDRRGLDFYGGSCGQGCVGVGAGGRPSRETPTIVARRDAPGAACSRSAGTSTAVAADSRPLQRSLDRPRDDGPSAGTHAGAPPAPRPPPASSDDYRSEQTSHAHVDIGQLTPSQSWSGFDPTRSPAHLLTLR